MIVNENQYTKEKINYYVTINEIVQIFEKRSQSQNERIQVKKKKCNTRQREQSKEK